MIQPPLLAPPFPLEEIRSRLAALCAVVPRGKRASYPSCVALMSRLAIWKPTFDTRSFKGSPQAEYSGAYHVTLPELGLDLKAMGFNLVSYANNTFDQGLERMPEACRVLDQNGVVYGRCGHRRAPSYQDGTLASLSLTQEGQ